MQLPSPNRQDGLHDAATGRPGRVPSSRAQRQQLLRLVQSYMAARRPTPPLAAGELRMHAESILKGAGLDDRHRDFVTVLVNNEAWRDAVAGIPYHRRLLLLPKCFRAEGECPADFDRFGLRCRRCGRCAIGELAGEAERLGYVVLVAEGAGAVTAVIESARLEAIVGVGCLPVLERVFPHMEAAAIPGIAVPLLYDGCRQTAADMDWIRDALYLGGEDKTHRLDLDSLREQVEAWFSAEAIGQLLGPPASQTERIAHEWLGRAGKRWRPFLSACAYAAWAESPQAPLPADLARVALAVECFHKASLIHDDIEDQDEFRYGQRTVHQQHGVPMALNVGDFLLGEGYRLIGGCDAPADRKVAMLQAAAAGHRQLCLGQGEELAWMRQPRPLTAAEVLGIFRHKTAPAFEVALRLGTLYAGDDRPVRDVIAQFSCLLGVAYQIRDDLDDFDPRADGSDSRAMRPSLLLAVAWELAGPTDRPLLERLWRRECDIEGESDRLERALRELKVRETAHQLLESYKAEAVAALAPLENPSLKGILRRVIGRIFNEDELKGWCGESESADAPGRQAGGESVA